jgi:hypothetical protein
VEEAEIKKAHWKYSTELLRQPQEFAKPPREYLTHETGRAEICKKWSPRTITSSPPPTPPTVHDNVCSKVTYIEHN